MLTRVYSEMKKQMPGLNISLSVIEVVYNEEQKSENIIDLLDVSCKELILKKVDSFQALKRTME